jgi:hypothetical protein
MAAAQKVGDSAARRPVTEIALPRVMSFLAIGPAATKNDMKFSLRENERRLR